MAIRKLKFVQVWADADNYKEMLIKAYGCEDFHAELATSIIDRNNGDQVLKEDTFYRDTMNELRHLSSGAGCKITLLDTVKKFPDDEVKQFLAELSEQFKAVTEINQSAKLDDADEVALAKLIDIGLEKIHNCEYLKFGFGRLSKDAYKKLLLHDTNMFSVVELNSDAKTHWICYVTSNDYYKEVKRIFDSLYFEEMKIPPIDVNNVICHYNSKINEIYTYCNYRHELLRLYKFVALIDEKYVVSGFIPVDTIDKFKQTFDGMDVEINIQDVITQPRMSGSDKAALAKLSEFGLEKVNNCQYLRFGFGRIDNDDYATLLEKQDEKFTISEIYSNSGSHWICFVTSNNLYHEVRLMLKTLHFVEIRIPKIDINAIVNLYKDKLNAIYTYCNYSDEILKSASLVARVKDAYVLSGYLAPKDLDGLKAAFKDIQVKIESREVDDADMFVAEVTAGNLFVQIRSAESDYKEALAAALKYGALHMVPAESILDEEEGGRVLEANNFYCDTMDQLNELAEKAGVELSVGETITKFSDDEIKQFITEMTDKLETVEEPEKEALVPPTLLKNNWFVRPFESFVNMYSIPSYRDFDPTAFVCFTYCILFGMMFSDFGQGLVFAVGGAILYKLHPKMALAGIAARIGLFSMLFGFLFGSVFGYEDLLTPLHQMLFGTTGKLIDVMDSGTTTTLLIISIAMGALLIITTMSMNIVLKIKHKDWGELIFSNNGIAGFLMYGYAIVAAVELAVYNNNIVTTPYLIPFVYVPIICFLMEKQMVLFFDGYGLKPHNGWGNYFIESFFEVFEVLLGFITNSMSYLRVVGFVLSHAGMMMVVMTLGEMTANASWIVIILGNIFVMCLEGLIVAIQALRLEYYEMFSRYYTGGGRKFKAITSVI